MSSDFLGSLMYLMHLCQSLPTKEWNQLLVELANEIGRELMTEILWKGLYGINKTTSLNKVRSLIKLASLKVYSIQMQYEKTIFDTVSNINSNHPKQILDITNCSKPIIAIDSLLQTLDTEMNSDTDNRLQVKKTLNINNKNCKLKLDELHVDTLNAICHFLEFKELIQFEKCSRYLCMIARMPASVECMNYNQFFHVFWAYYQHEKRWISMERFSNIESLSLQARYEWFAPNKRSIALNNSNYSMNAINIQQLQTELGESEIITKPYCNMLYVLELFCGNKLRKSIKSLKLSIDTNFLRIKMDEKKEEDMFASRMPYFCNVEKLEFVNMKLTHILDVLHTHQYCLNNLDLLSLDNVQCDSKTSTWNDLSIPKELLKNIEPHEIYSLIDYILKMRNLKSIKLSVSESNYLQNLYFGANIDRLLANKKQIRQTMNKLETIYYESHGNIADDDEEYDDDRKRHRKRDDDRKEDEKPPPKVFAAIIKHILIQTCHQLKKLCFKSVNDMEMEYIFDILKTESGNNKYFAMDDNCGCYNNSIPSYFRWKSLLTLYLEVNCFELVPLLLNISKSCSYNLKSIGLLLWGKYSYFNGWEDIINIDNEYEKELKYNKILFPSLQHLLIKACKLNHILLSFSNTFLTPYKKLIELKCLRLLHIYKLINKSVMKKAYNISSDKLDINININYHHNKWSSLHNDDMRDNNQLQDRLIYNSFNLYIDELLCLCDTLSYKCTSQTQALISLSIWLSNTSIFKEFEWMNLLKSLYHKNNIKSIKHDVSFHDSVSLSLKIIIDTDIDIDEKENHSHALRMRNHYKLQAKNSRHHTFVAFKQSDHCSKQIYFYQHIGIGNKCLFWEKSSEELRCIDESNDGKIENVKYHEIDDEETYEENEQELTEKIDTFKFFPKLNGFNELPYFYDNNLMSEWGRGTIPNGATEHETNTDIIALPYSISESFNY